MCEWLCGAAAAHAADWCDVSLVCGGRTIGAHRAVLASVSAFMKKLFISCHDDDSPTLIVLPDFELDSMLSVLFYIYNGEVVVPRSRVESFLDIIIALKIYVDKQVLDNIQKDLQGFNDKIGVIGMNSSEISKSLHAPKVSLYSPSDMDESFIITIKRNSHSPSRHDVANTFKLLERYKNQSQKLHSENLQSQHRDRQKKSLRHDSFTETYPRNGNSNGLSASVPAIRNEGNLDNTSEFLMNANDNSRCVDALTAATDAAADTCTADVISNAKPRSTVEIMEEKTNKLRVRPKIYQRDKDLEKNTQATTAMSLAILELPNRVIQKNVYLDLRSTENILSSALTQHNQTYTKQEKPQKDVDRCCATKATISNRVMQSPWCPQLPISYRPFRSKKSESNSNDTNNNIELPREHSGNVLLTNMVSAEITEGEKQLPESVTESTELKCQICCQVYPDSDLLATHMKCHPSTARFTCSDCGKTFSQLRNYKYHMSVHRGTREFAATCTVCGKYFNDRGYLSSHMKIHRNRKEYKCQLCPKSFNQRVAYNMHVRIHTGVKPHVCEECGKAFSRKMLLKQHQRTHSGERPYACPHCEKRFADRSNMTLHLRLHTGVKPFSCTLCPKSFTKKHHLKSHLNFHTGAKPYSCPRCHLAFTQSSNMRTHLKKCTN